MSVKFIPVNFIVKCNFHLKVLCGLGFFLLYKKLWLYTVKYKKHAAN